MMCVSAQVTIGTNNDPHAGAVLDLQSTSKGLLLPRISLTNVTTFTLDEKGADTAATAKGMVVYNTNANITGGAGVGVYVWDGAKWTTVGGTNNVAVDKSKLLTLVTTASQYISREAEYIPETFTLFEDAYNAALAALASSTATQSEVDAAWSALAEAIMNLQSKPVVVLVNSITITGSATATVSTPVTMTADVLPSNAANKTITWSKVSGTAATISTSGVLTPTAAGTVTVRATASDGSGVNSANYTVTVTAAKNPDDTVDEKIGNNTYKTYDYNGTVWMVENSMEGTSSAQMYNNNASQVNGYYYTYTQAAGACPEGWHLPTTIYWNNLLAWVNANKSHNAAKWWITDTGSAFAGYRSSDDTWSNWGTHGYWWGAGASNQGCYANTGGMYGPGTGAGHWFSVRCVQD